MAQRVKVFAVARDGGKLHLSYYSGGRGRGRGAGRQRGREGGREAEREAERQRGRQRGREGGREAEREAGRQRGRQRGREGGREAERQRGRQRGRQGGREGGREAEREAGRQRHLCEFRAKLDYILRVMTSRLHRETLSQKTKKKKWDLLSSPRTWHSLWNLHRCAPLHTQ